MAATVAGEAPFGHAHVVLPARRACRPRLVPKIHDLRLRFCATMLAIALHRRETMELNEGFSAADMELWSILEQEGF